MITRKNGGRGRDLLVTLFDQLFENAGTGAEAGLNLRQSMLSISLPDEKVDLRIATASGAQSGKRAAGFENCGIEISAIASSG